MNRVLSIAAAALIVGFGLLGSVVKADDDTTADERPSLQRSRVVERAPGKYWIGVHAIPIDAALKSHLKLGDRLIVRAVMPDSPAAKGGLTQHDILLKFGDRAVANLRDLLKVVANNKDKPVKVVVLRSGEESTLEIRPAERPADVEANLPEELSPQAALDNWFGGLRGRRFRMIVPGAFEELPALPGNLSITVSKQNDGPAKITVQHDGRTWEITEDEIDELPEDVREHVRRRVDGRRPRVWAPDEDATMLFPLVPEGADNHLREQMERAVKELEKLQRRFSEEEPFKALREEMKSLREEVERLRQRDQPTDSPSSEARDV